MTPSLPRWLTIDPSGELHEVTNLYDRFANDTEDPALAESCVIRLGKHRWLSLSVEEAPIYTWH